MTVFDYAVLAILAISVIVSAIRGLVREILSLIGWIAAFVVAGLFAEGFGHWLTFLPAHPALRLIVAYLLLLIGTAIAMAIVNWGLMKAIQASGLTLADRGLGGLFGLARGIVIVLALVMVCGMTKLPQMDVWKQATFSPLAETAVRTVLPWLPDAVAGKVKF